MVPSWEVHFAPARSAREVAFAYLLFCFVMLGVDILYAYIDPRIKAKYKA